MMNRKIAVLMMSCSMLTACSLVPEFKKPDVPNPQNWEQTAGSAAATERNVEWWGDFKSDELNALVQTALANNRDVEAALARIEQSRAQMRIAGGPLYPQLSAGGSASHSDSSPGSADDSLKATANLSYEVDLFGRKKATYAAAGARLKASEFDEESLRLVVAGDVAQAYFDILTLLERQRIAQQNLTSAEEVLKIIDAQFNAGRISGLEVSQQRAELANARAQLASLNNQVVATRNGLAILLGQAPQGFTTSGGSFDVITMPVIQLSLPAEVIAQRPDIRRSEATLIAANADIGVARAAFFPSLTLSADASALADPSATAFSLAAALLQPVFKGGALRGQQELSEARKRELVANYQQTVLTALAEVENALSGLKTASERHTQFQIASEAADNAYTIATNRFEAGAIDFQTLLDTQRAQLQASDSFYQAKQEALTAAVDLYRAMGGGWK